MHPDEFPILRASARSPTRFESALRTVSEALHSGTIRNSVFKDLKFDLSNVVEDGWSKHIQDPFFNAMKWKNQPKDVQELSDNIMIMGLHSVLGASKKVANSQAQGAPVDAMRAYMAEVLPLVHAMASLKDKVVMGRAPSTGPSKPQNPGKVLKTCPVCFRPIAVVVGKMAHHGFKRPGIGWQTASCPGVRFRPLEVSNEGLVWLIGALKEQLARTQEIFRNRHAKESFIQIQEVRRGGEKKLVTFTRESPEWTDMFKVWVRELDSEIGSLSREIPTLEVKLAAWKPEVAIAAGSKRTGKQVCKTS